MSFVKGLRCRECGEVYEPAPNYFCELCFGPLEVTYDYDAMKQAVSREKIQAGPTSIWRYKDLLPVGDRLVDINTGFTPLIRAENLGRELGLDNLYIKNDCVNPTYSFKDRPVATATSKALDFGFDTIACASTGNLAGSVAAHGAKAGMKTYVFIPANLEPSKIVGAGVYQPNLVAVDGNYDEVNRLCTELADRFGWAFVNINMRPYYAEGSKTLAYEVVEQLGWRAPDHVVVPIASGCLFTKIHKGFKELVTLGLIDEQHVRMSGAQAAGCGPVADAYARGSLDFIPVKPNTIAKSLAIGNPADGYYVLKIARETDGAIGAVSDEEIIDGIKLLARTEGIYAETAGGVTVATLRQLVQRGVVKRDELTVAYITGNGYKTSEAIADHLGEVWQIKPSLKSFEEALNARTSQASSAGEPKPVAVPA